MAIEHNITASDHVFIGEDKTLEFTIYADSTEAEVVDASGFAMSFIIRKHDDSSTIVVEKSTEESPAGITITGSFNSDPDVNTQKVVVTLADTDTYDAEASPVVNVAPGPYRYTMKRTDAGSETVLAFGGFYFLQGTAR